MSSTNDTKTGTKEETKNETTDTKVNDGNAPEEIVNSGAMELSRIAKEDTKRWWQKRNLRSLYLILVPCALGVEWTSGFDSSMMVSPQTGCLIHI